MSEEQDKKNLREKERNGTMNGTEKQVKWAEDIKARMLADIEANESKIPADQRDFFEACKTTILSINDARFWIDHRGKDNFVGFCRLAKRLADGTLQYRGIEYADVMQLVKDDSGKWQVKTSKINL